jgi:hypothetical protein
LSHESQFAATAALLAAMDKIPTSSERFDFNMT